MIVDNNMLKGRFVFLDLLLALFSVVYDEMQWLGVKF